MFKKILITVLVAIFTVIIFFSIFAFIKYKQVVVKVNKDSSNLITPTPTPDPNEPFAILLMGYGGGVHEGGKLTDSIIVAQVIPKEKKIKLISVPRDSWVPIPIAVGETKMLKVNEANSVGLDDKKYPNKETQYTGDAGGGQMAKAVLAQILNIRIDNFITIDFAGFLKTIDTLGGIDVNVQRTFDDYLYPIEENITDPCGKSDAEIASLTATMSGTKLEEQFTCRYEHLHFDKGLQHMDSVTALKFVRSRHSLEDGGDFNRSARQKLVIEAVKKKVISLNFVSKIIPFVNSLSGNLITDINLDKMQKLISRADDFQTYQIESFPITNDNLLKDAKSSIGQAILIPRIGENNWIDIQNFVAQPTATASSKLN